MTVSVTRYLSICLLFVGTLVVPTAAKAQAPCTWEIGIMGALSGDYAYYGIPLANGIDLAIAEANAEDDLACTLEASSRDTQGDPNQAPPLAEHLVNRERLVACLCGFFSGETLATGSIFDEAGVLMASSGTNPVNARQGFSTYFRAVANDNEQAQALARYLKHRFSPRRVALVTDHQDYGVSTMRRIRRSLGWRVQDVMRIEPQESDYRRAVKRIEEIGADLVVYLGYAQQAAPLLLQLRDAGLNIPFATNGSVDDRGFTRIIRRNWGQRPIRAFGSCACNDPARIPGATDFADAYRERFGQDPRLLAGDMYDVANIVIDFLRTKMGAESVTSLRAEIVAHFDTLEKAPGVIKRYTWKANGELRAGDRHTFVFKWRNDDWQMRGSVYELRS